MLSTAACHEAPNTVDGEPAPIEIGARPWPSEQLCTEGVFIRSRGANAEDHLSVKDVPMQGGPQELELSAEVDDTFRHVWQLIRIDVEAGIYRIQNLRPPGNFLATTLDARGASVNFEPSELEWQLQRVTPARDDDPDAWFELIPAATPDISLGISTSKPHEMNWFTRDDSNPPKAAQWAFARVALCDLTR